MNSFVRAASENWEHWNGSLVSIVPQSPVASVVRSKNTRWLVLALSCFLLFGNYYAYDNPASLNTFLQPYLGISYDEWQLVLSSFYAIYSLPNTVLPLLGGSLLDYYDPRIVLLVFSSSVLGGQLLFSVGTMIRSSSLMLLGRLFFGIGGESCGVVQSWIVARCFRGREMAFALGLTLSIARLGSVANSVLSPRFANRWGVSCAVWVGFLTCLFSFCCAVGLCLLMTRFRKMLTQKTSSSNSPEETERLLSDSIVKEAEPAVLFEDDDDTDPAATPRPLCIKRRSEMSLIEPPPDVGCFSRLSRALACFPVTFWLISTICILLYGTVVPFNNVASDFLQSKWFHHDPEMAGLVMSIPDTLSALLVPPLGFLVDRYGRRASMLIFGSATIASVHFVLGLTAVQPIGPFVALGISYSIYGVAIWPSIACVIDHEDLLAVPLGRKDVIASHLGMAYGLATAFLNTALTVFPLIVALVRVNYSTTWIPLELMFASMASVGFILGIFLYYIDFNNSSVLENPTIVSRNSFDEFDDEDSAEHSESSDFLFNL